jgi:HSP20 family protein
MPSRDPSAWMWQEACAMLDRAERMQREFFQLSVERQRGPVWQPPVDIVESEDELVIVVALPGVRPRDIDVRVDGGTLVIAAVRSLPAAGSGGVIQRLEIPHGRFERRIGLGSQPLQLERRDVVDGCLILAFRKIP